MRGRERASEGWREGGYGQSQQVKGALYLAVGRGGERHASMEYRWV